MLLVQLFLFGSDRPVGAYHAVVEDQDEQDYSHAQDDMEGSCMEESPVLRVYFLLKFRLEVFHIRLFHYLITYFFPFMITIPL